MNSEVFEKKVISTFKTAPHVKDEVLIELRKSYQSYYSLFDDLLWKFNIACYDGGNNLVVGDKVFTKFKKSKDNDEWMAREMLYKIRNVL